MKAAEPMTRGPPLGLLLRFAIPLMLGDLVHQAYTIADSMAVGRLIGVRAFAAVSAGGFFYWLALVIIFGFSHGFGTLIAQCFGAGDRRSLGRSCALSLELGAVIALVMTALCLLLLRPVLALMHTPQDIFEDTFRYLRVMFAGILFTFTGNVLSSVFRALGDSKTPLCAFIASAVLNIVLDIALIRWTGLGVAAAALATVIAQALSALFCFWRLFRRREIRLCPGDFAPDRKVIRELLRLGAPIGARDCIAAAGGTVIQYVINGYGTIAIAGIAAAKKLYSLLFIIGGGLDGAAATFIAQNYGARRFDRIASGMAAARRIMLAGLLFIMPLMFFAGRRILGLFISGSPEETGAVLDAAVNQMRVCLVLLPALYMLFLYRSGLQGMGNSVMPMASGFLEAGLRAAGALILPRFLGLWGVYIAEPIGWPLMALQLFAAFQMDYRKKRSTGGLGSPD